MSTYEQRKEWAAKYNSLYDGPTGEGNDIPDTVSGTLERISFTPKADLQYGDGYGGPDGGGNDIPDTVSGTLERISFSSEPTVVLLKTNGSVEHTTGKVLTNGVVKENITEALKSNGHLEQVKGKVTPDATANVKAVTQTRMVCGSTPTSAVEETVKLGATAVLPARLSQIKENATSTDLYSTTSETANMDKTGMFWGGVLTNGITSKPAVYSEITPENTNMDKTSRFMGDIRINGVTDKTAVYSEITPVTDSIDKPNTLSHLRDVKISNAHTVDGSMQEMTFSSPAINGVHVLASQTDIGSTDKGFTDGAGSTQPLTVINTATATSNGCISWDLSAMEQHIADLERAAQDLQNATTAYKQLRERVSTSWQSNAANVFLSEMCIDLDDYAKLVANINTLATALKSVKDIYSGCESEVVRNMCTLDAQLAMLGGTKTV